MLLKDIMSRERLYDPRNTSMVLCDAALDRALNRKALHLCQVREVVCEQLVVKPVQPISNAHLFGTHHSGEARRPPRIILTQVPNEIDKSEKSGGSSAKVAPNEALYPGMQKLPYIPPETKFYVRQDFLAVLRTLPQVKSHQTVFEYSELSKLLTSYILKNKARLFDQRNIKVVLCEGDLLGRAFGVKAFYRTQVMAFLRSQLITFPPHSDRPLFGFTSSTTNNNGSGTSQPGSSSGSSERTPRKRAGDLNDGSDPSKKAKAEEERDDQGSEHKDEEASELRANEVSLSSHSRLATSASDTDTDTDVNDIAVGNYTEYEVDSEDDRRAAKANQELAANWSSEEDSEPGIQNLKIVSSATNEGSDDAQQADGEADDVSELELNLTIAVASTSSSKFSWKCLQCKLPIHIRSGLCTECFKKKKGNLPSRKPLKKRSKGKSSAGQKVKSKKKIKPVAVPAVQKAVGPILFQEVSAWLSALDSTQRTRLRGITMEEAKRIFLAEHCHRTESEDVGVKNEESNLCNFCLDRDKNAGFVHGKIVHQVSCYPCAKKLFKQRQGCPICRRKIEKIVEVHNC